MRTIKAYKLGTDEYVEYIVPSRTVSARHLKETHGSQYDHIERRTFDGGLPLAWVRKET